MRVSQRSIARNYMKNLNTTLDKRTQSIERGASGLKFKTLSENVADGSRAMKIQETRYKSEQQLENVENTQLELDAMDGNLDSIGDILTTVYEKAIQAKSESYGETARQILATEIKNKKAQILQFANAQFGGNYLFGGSNNGGPSLTEGANGELLYNGAPMKDIYKDATDGKYYYETTPGDPTTKTLVPLNEDVYMDIGLGVRFGNDSSPDPRTAFKISMSGLDIMGFVDGKANPTDLVGEKGTAVANNIYDLLSQLEKSISTSDRDGLSDQLTQLTKLTDKSGMARTELGTRMDFLERTSTRLTNEIDNLGAMESKLVSADPAAEAIKFKECEYSWMAILQLGSQVLPSSLLDYMR